MKGITSNGLVICVTDIDTSFAGQCPSGQVMRGVSSSGSAICIPDSDTTYDGTDFAESGQTCSYGSSVYGISSNGQVICTPTQIYAGSGLELNGNYLSISSYGCIAGEVMKRNLGNYGWECVEDEDTTYDGNDFAISNQVCAAGQKVSGINSAGGIVCVSDLVNTYDGTDFALSGQTCNSSQKILAINNNGQVICASDLVNTYDGTDFALNNQACGNGQQVKGINAQGYIICITDLDTQLTEYQVDAFVANNGYERMISMSYIDLDDAATFYLTNTEFKPIFWSDNNNNAIFAKSQFTIPDSQFVRVEFSGTYYEFRGYCQTWVGLHDDYTPNSNPSYGWYKVTEWLTTTNNNGNPITALDSRINVEWLIDLTMLPVGNTHEVYVHAISDCSGINAPQFHSGSVGDFTFGASQSATGYDRVSPPTTLKIFELEQSIITTNPT